MKKALILLAFLTLVACSNKQVMLGKKCLKEVKETESFTQSDKNKEINITFIYKPPQTNIKHNARVHLNPLRSSRLPAR